MSAAPSQSRLLAIIELQNAIAAAAMTADEVMHIVAERAGTLLAAEAAAVALVEGDEIVHRSVVGSGWREAGSRVPRTASLAGRSIAERRALRIDDAAAEPLAIDPMGEIPRPAGGAVGGPTPGARHSPIAELGIGTGIRSVACVPLLYGEIAVGALVVGAAGSAAFSDEDVETLRMLGQIVAIALHRAYTYPRPRYDSLQDALTGLGNRRAFDERLDAELNRNRRFRHSFSLALVELDGLETAIDRLGQAAGDEMLRRVATILKQHTRMIDGSFRIRADELAIVMPGTSLEGAQVVAERCRAHALEAKVCDGGVRLGFGVVAAAAVDETAPEIFARASAALAQDTSRGR
ncbi:MAG: sensor domain-containing diguanylate cyclase [Deltaproteobacteria bacterium]|nr:MAG: sensor domain-containing diguanylate cyclase [Deltaproteobacteria bacterium]TMQ20379.1 MAG: sensor domain-containing diguanylate cyclase [Deltaproteobacteria bacterium]